MVLTEWDEFRDLDFARIFKVLCPRCLRRCSAPQPFPVGLQAMLKPSFVFDGRNILPHKALSQIGFEVHKIGSAGPLQS